MVATWIVVEDEPDLYEMVLAMYDLMGVDGLSFTNGEDAFTWVEEVDDGNLLLEEIPGLALIDIRLPGKLSGLDVGERLRKSEKTRNMVIVLMTAYRMDPQQEAEALRRTQADRLLYKPLPNLDELMRLLETLRAARTRTLL